MLDSIWTISAYKSQKSIFLNVSAILASTEIINLREVKHIIHEFILYYILKYVHQVKKIYILEIPHFMLCNLPFLYIHIFAVLSRCRDVTLKLTALIISTFTRLAFGLKRTSKWIIVQHSNVIQTQVIVIMCSSMVTSEQFYIGTSHNSSWCSFRPKS